MENVTCVDMKTLHLLYKMTAMTVQNLWYDDNANTSDLWWQIINYIDGNIIESILLYCMSQQKSDYMIINQPA